ncbi:BMP family ABC transporter substrate-binding protein [Streptacidiphilus sp. PB12-B1b]|uniref:BMP family lipoprotein n=1 Tax=Streptacidiphilus sp. PB12-B1b TaxID=2705012 RepID=UPI0015FE5596|nr:BMP family ABC transporter substrate-binding protein [Streptacidiphilus sp. PB12-B1b]QMU77719.1 BMP family ABC transporter substrate-binding protein [Streptacidiphilus sp. PB12-B1b]
MKKTVQLAAALVTVGLTLTACGSKPVSTAGSPSGSASGSTATTAGSYKACMVTDTGGLDDHSFNAESWAGMQDAAKADSKITVQNATSATENDYASNIAGFVSAGCKLIVTVGFAMDDATVASAKKNPSQDYTIVDNTSTAPKIKGLQFNTAQGAFLGGYFAAGMTKTGRVATFGGANYPTVTVYMDGFWEGVQYYNQQHHTNVKVLGWNQTTQSGTFDPTQSFTDEAGGKQIAATFQAEGADIIFPVAGGTGIGALAQAKASNGALNAIWVDDDGFYSNSAYASVIMTSVTKGIASAVSTAVTGAAAGGFTSTSYIGTLANDGTGLAPYHDFTSKVPAALTTELATVKQGIISGSIKITSKNQPTP